MKALSKPLFVEKSPKVRLNVSDKKLAKFFLYKIYKIVELMYFCPKMTVSRVYFIFLLKKTVNYADFYETANFLWRNFFVLLGLLYLPLAVVKAARLPKAEKPTQVPKLASACRARSPCIPCREVDGRVQQTTPQRSLRCAGRRRGQRRSPMRYPARLTWVCSRAKLPKPKKTKACGG